MIMKKDIDLNEYKTSDLALATAISLFHPLQSIDRQNPTKSLFIFRKNKSLDKVINNYWEGKLKVEPKSYFNQLKTLKSRIYSG